MNKNNAVNFPIRIKRIYELPLPDDGLRILVDRLWPRGITKDRAAIDYWYKEITPSSDLRKWFGHKSENFKEFARLYMEELKANEGILQKIKLFASKTPVTLLYAAKDPEINHAIVLKKVIEEI